MSAKPAEGTLLLLDACCIINLYATGQIEEIFRHLPYRLAASRLVVEREVLTVRRAMDAAGNPDREPVSLTTLESSGLLAIMDISSYEEKAEFAGFAAELDDGEASVCALAVIHGGAVATDDRKALRILSSRGMPALQTPELLFEWARRAQVPRAQVGEVLRTVRDLARFYPRRAAPHFLWWNSFFR